MLPIRKLNEKSATLSWDVRQKPVALAPVAYLKGITEKNKKPTVR